MPSRVAVPAKGIPIAVLLFFLCFGVCRPAPGWEAGDDTPANGASILPASEGATTSVILPREEKPEEGPGIAWSPAMGQAALFLAIAQAFRLATQPDTREALKGPYFKDYFTSLKGLGGWNDGDPPIANYVAHPMEGSICTWVLVHNDPKSARLEFGMNKPYWISRLKGTGFSAAFSTFYELGPVGDAAVGNLGMNPDHKGAVDLVITPTVGLGWHLTEDMLDRYFIRWVESKTGNIWANMMVRAWLNPTRSFANILRFTMPWKRESRLDLKGIRRQHRRRELERGIPTMNGRP